MSGTARALYLLSGGWLRLERSFLTGEGNGHVLVPVPMALVDTADGYVLFDTGMNCDGIQDPGGTWGPRARSIQPQLVPEDDVRIRLSEVGVDVADIRLVINSHLHWDHCGGNRIFTRCPVLVQRAELAFARAPSGPVQGGYMTNHFEVPVSYRPLDGDEEVAPGVRVLATHGHTPGHQSLSVTLADREVVLCADAAYTYDTLERRLLSGNIWDSARTLASLERLRDLAASGATVLPGHEPSLWARLGQPPVRFR